ncbi:MAG: hypothetical protein R3281_17065 [Balneolaceae bacterium]|nr:hypothetical protein [Balneolaceae bacterium]
MWFCLRPEQTSVSGGREAVIDTYAEFLLTSEVTAFHIEEMLVDHFEATAVVYYTFNIRYRVENTAFDETGSEILVFERHADQWLVVWRRQYPSSI